MARLVQLFLPAASAAKCAGINAEAAIKTGEGATCADPANNNTDMKTKMTWPNVECISDDG